VNDKENDDNDDISAFLYEVPCH